jgi:uncharacterized protein with PQ loop repeat
MARMLISVLPVELVLLLQLYRIIVSQDKHQVLVLALILMKTGTVLFQTAKLDIIKIHAEVTHIAKSVINLALNVVLLEITNALHV